MFNNLGPILSSSLERAPWGWATFVLLIAGYLKIKPLMKELADKREGNLLEERAKEMASMRERLDALESKLDITNEELRIVRHDLANTNQAFDSFIDRVMAEPEKAASIAAVVHESRNRAKARAERDRDRLAEARLAIITKAAPGHT